MIRVTPEMVAGIRELVAKTPRGLRPMSVPGEVVHSLAEALFALGDLQNATGALLSSMHDVHVCHACRAIATRRLWNEPGMSWFGCDEHGATHSEDLPHAPAIRTLRALLEGKPGDTKTEVERLKAERDHQQKHAEALEDAARALVADLDKEARQCGKCYALATVAQGLPRGGFVFHCDKHATPLSAGWQDDPREDYPTNVVAPLRALRALLGVKP